MLKKQLQNYIEQNNPVALTELELTFAKANNLLVEGVEVVPATIQPTVFERCNKETEDSIAAVDQQFLAQPISHLKEHQEEFVYIEAERFGIVRIDAISLELDEMFKNYTAMFGFAMQKKYGDAIKAYLDEKLKDVSFPYSASFSGQDGLWEINMNIAGLPGFNEEQSFEKVIDAIYEFIFKLLEALEQK